MNYVQFNAEYGGSSPIYTDVYKIEVAESMEDDPSFATLRIWNSDPEENPEDYEILPEAFIEEAYTIPSQSHRDRFEIKLAKSHSTEDLASGEVFNNIEYCKRHYPNAGTDFQISLIGTEYSYSFRERGIGGTIEYNEIVGLELE